MVPPATMLNVLFGLVLVIITSSGCAKQEDAKETHLLRANDYVSAGEYDKAAKEYREVLGLDPADPVATRQLGTIYFNQGQLPQAYPLLKKAAELQPDDPELQFNLGLTSVAAGEYQEARDAALRALEKQPGGEQALMLLANTAVALDDVGETRKLIESLREKDKDRPGYHLALGILDLHEKDQSGAEAEFNASLKLDPKSAATYAALANLYWNRKDLNAADQAFKAAVDLSSPRSPIRLQYADFKLRAGALADAKGILEEISSKAPDYLPARAALMKIACAEHLDDECAASVKNILAPHPMDFDALLQDGILNIGKGDAGKAVRELEYLRSIYIKNPQVRYQLARAYILLASKSASVVDSRDAMEKAERNLDEAIKLDPHFDAATLLLAEIKIRKGSAAAAVDLLAPLTKERPPIAQAHYVLASAYLAQQRGADALAVYRQMMELFPKDPQPSFLVGTLLLAQRQQADARKAFEKSIEISPDYLPAIEKLVDIDIAEQQYATAMNRVHGLIEKDPKLAQPWGMRGKIYFAQKDFSHAEADLLKAIELDPSLEPAYLLLAQLYVATNKQDQAIEKLNAFVEKTKDVPALLQLGLIHERLKHFEAARDTYEKLLAVNPNVALALNNLADIYSEHLGQPDKAYELAKKARELAPNEPHAADTLGWILFKKGDYTQALQLLQDSASQLTDEPVVQFHLGMADYMLGHEGQARIALQKAADANADFPEKEEARKRLSVLAIDAGMADAQPELEKYLREQPSDPVALTRLAALQQREGAADQAIKTYEKVIAENPLYAPGVRQLALLYSQRSTDEPKAFDLLTKARQAYPGDPEIAKTLGILNYRRGFYPQSAELLKEAAVKRKDDPEILYYLGQASRELKQWNECKDTLEQALSLNLPSDLADEAKRALATCSETAP
jgi:tetratricopeptide (TPR) repeat protein